MQSIKDKDTGVIYAPVKPLTPQAKKAAEQWIKIIRGQLS